MRLMTKFQLALILAAFSALLSAQDKAIDVHRSTITIHVGKAGLFSAAGHEHWINAPINSGTLSESGTPQVEFTVQSAKMTVKPDPKVDEKTQAQIQKDMEEMTLEPAKYPEISFRSTRVDKTGDGQWNVEGTLSLHGASKPIVLAVKRSGDAYTGRVSVKQTDFGIKPVSVAGGTIKVKNEIDIEFQIFAQ
jgi:polyisoprenoid-binding protein YceI